MTIGRAQPTTPIGTSPRIGQLECFRLREIQPQIVETARLAFGELAVASSAVEKRDKAGLPSLEELAIG